MNKITIYFLFIVCPSLSLSIEIKPDLTSSDNVIDDRISSNETKPKLTFDEFFDYTTFTSLSFSPTGQYLLVEKRRPSWNSSSYENSLWLYDIERHINKLITKDLRSSLKPQWSPSGNWIALSLNENSLTDITNDIYYKEQSWLEEFDPFQQRIYLYSIKSGELLPIQIGQETPNTLAWSYNDSSIYFAGTRLTPKSQQKQPQMSTIYRIDIDLKDRTLFTKMNVIKNVSFLISELLFVPSETKLVFSSLSTVVENPDDFEIYSLDLKDLSLFTRLTNNTVKEKQLQLSTDGKSVLFTILILLDGTMGPTTAGLYALNLTDGKIQRFGERFNGSIKGYTIKSNGGVYILGQWRTDVEIYSQQSPTESLFYHPAWIGTYESIASSSNPKCSIAFVYSSSNWPMEVYCANSTEHLVSANEITHENELFTKRDLPQIKMYNWTNKDDYQKIEGILHYPPGKFEFKNLPLLVLIHGGPKDASLNKLDASWYSWAPLAASEGWLVLEPNYRGSTGYGTRFMTQIRRRPLSLPGRDILSGVDQLIEDGIADPYRLAVGGFSYGGDLTNWLITRTKRFNVALSGAGSVEYASDWGTIDDPAFYKYWFGGSPWEIPHIYQNEAPIYQLDRVRTPTHIVTGEHDARVPPRQSYILERGLYSLGIPVKLIIFPNEGHTLNNDPWHGKIKVREELKWLKKYGEGPK